MAMSIRVREKSAWKTLHIPQDLRNTGEFDGLLEIQELTEYELVSREDDSDIEALTRPTSNKRKRKSSKQASSSPAEVAGEAKGKKRKMENDGSDVTYKEKSSLQDTGITNSLNLAAEVAREKKLGKNKSGILKAKRHNPSANLASESPTIMEVTGDETVELCDTLENNEHEKKVSSIVTSAAQTKKLNRKKGKKQNKSAEKTETSVSDDKLFAVTEASDKLKREASDNSQTARNKRKKKKAKKQKNLRTECMLKEKSGSNVGASSSGGDEVEEDLPERKNKELDMSYWKNLCVPDVLLRGLRDQGFDSPTRIQSMALPSAIRDRRDILGAAETGSGKTLAFGIPVLARILSSMQAEVAKKVQSYEGIEEEMISDDDGFQEGHAAKENLTSPPMALILEPTRELAMQVKSHLIALARYTDIKFVTVVGGMSIDKQRRILGKKPHVVIATPGRLWQLIEEGNEHVGQVDRVLCLVVDEADRMIEKGHYEELTKLLEMINGSPRRVKNRQTFVMSATLTIDIGAPKRIKNKVKRKVKEEDKLKTLTERICVGSKPKVIDLTPKEKVAQTLTELRVNCKADEKDFYLYYFLCHHPGRTLVFANSKDCLRRLVALFTLLHCSPLPMHADMHQRQRLKNLDKFAANKRGLLVASDVAARGLDIPNVDHVIHYQVPKTIENYVHRSGRTARAANLGLSVMLVAPEDARDYRKIVHNIRNGEELPLLPIEMDLFPLVKQRVGLAREIDVREYRLKKKRLRNNFFTKAAQEMDMIIDDNNLMEDMGDSVEQAQDKQQLKALKTQLTSILHGPLQPTYMTKYPTKSGQLVSRKAVNLHQIRHFVRR